MNKRASRERRGLKTKKIQQNAVRIVVFRSNEHIYAQITKPSENGNTVLVAASSLDKELRSTEGNKVEKAKQVGLLLGARAKAQEIVKVVFDRAGYAYHGRVQALAEGAREGGLDF